MRSFVKVFIVSLFVIIVTSYKVAAAEPIQPLLTPSKEEITQKWIELDQNRFNLKDPFLEIPLVKPPYKIGKLHPDYIKQGVKTANFYRYMSGLPMNLIDTEELNSLSQYGAVVLAKTGYLTHYPIRPNDVPKDFFEQGYESTSTSNLAQMWFDSEANQLSYSVDMYMVDSDSSNISRVGHRMWVLSPKISQIGFGLAKGGDYGFSPMNVTRSYERKSKIAYNYFAYPGTGYYPKEYFSENNAWSISLNPNVFGVEENTNLTVDLIRKSDGQTWHFKNGEDDDVTKDKYFNISSGYGGVHAIIFRPDNLGYIHNNEKFNVIVKGLVDVSGNELPIEYTTEFFDLIPDRAYGKIFDNDNEQPISNMKVHFYKITPKGKKFYKTVISDEKGEYDFTGFPIGKYELKFVHPDYNSITEEDFYLKSEFDQFGSYLLEHYIMPLKVKKPVINKITDQSVNISGTADSNKQIVVKIGNETLKTRADQKGNFSVPIQKQKVNTVVKVLAQSDSGKMSDVVVVRVLDGTPPDSPKVNLITTKSNNIKGTVEPGALIKVYISNKYIGNAKADKNGKFTFNIQPQKVNTTVKFIAYDAAGNQSKPIVVKVKK